MKSLYIYWKTTLWIAAEIASDPADTYLESQENLLLSGPEAEEILFYFLFYLFLRLRRALSGYSWDLKIFLHIALSDIYWRENKRLLCWRVTQTAMITNGPLRCVSHLK